MAYIQNLLDYLDAACERNPDKIAFSDAQDSVTYRQLQARTYSVATALRLSGCAQNQPVAVLVERSADSVCALLGVLRAGCYYAPMDAEMPAERLEKMLRRLSPAAVLCASAAALDSIELVCPVLTYSGCFAMEAEPGSALRALDSDPAYVIFTSGSTGEPKGIVVSHRSVIDFTEWLARTCGYCEADCFGNQAPFYFDLSVKDLYQTLKHGATCHILSKTLFMFPLLLCQTLREKGVTALNWATSAFALVANSGAFAECVPESIKKITVGGEALQAKHVAVWRRYLPDAEITNLYGPTEVCVDCTYHRLERAYAADEPIPIGKACENKEVFLLTEDGRTAAVGEVGEICVAGSGLALGYFDEAEKSAAVFTQDPREPRFRRMIYHTGDLAVMGEDGLLYFRSRRDGQIKHQGYRIELGEIETAVLSVAEIASAACLFDADADRILCFYVGTIEGRALAKALRTRLPKYMVPNIYRQMDALPQNANGKTDRVRLMEAYQNELRTDA